MDHKTANMLNDLLIQFKNFRQDQDATDLVDTLNDLGFRFEASASANNAKPAIKPAKPAPPIKFLIGGVKHGGSCVRCSAKYQAGAAMFWSSGIGCWCPKCSTPEEQGTATTYWTQWLGKQPPEVRQYFEQQQPQSNVIPFQRRIANQ